MIFFSICNNTIFFGYTNHHTFTFAKLNYFLVGKMSNFSDAIAGSGNND